MTGPCKKPTRTSRYIIQPQIQMPHRPREKPKFSHLGSCGLYNSHVKSKKKSSQGGNMEKSSYKVSANVSLYNLTKNTNVSNKSSNRIDLNILNL